MNLLAVLLAASASTCSVTTAEETAQRSLGYVSFDSRPGPFGWRFLSASGCTDSAVSLLLAYADANATRLTGEQSRELWFHAGQALALAGREDESLAYFERAQSVAAALEWRTYVGATLAFLHRDTSALAAARQAYSEIAPGSMRLRIIDGFVACSAESYAKASHCRM